MKIGGTRRRFSSSAADRATGTALERSTQAETDEAPQTSCATSCQHAPPSVSDVSAIGDATRAPTRRAAVVRDVSERTPAVEIATQAGFEGYRPASTAANHAERQPADGRKYRMFTRGLLPNVLVVYPRLRREVTARVRWLHAPQPVHQCQSWFCHWA